MSASSEPSASRSAVAAAAIAASALLFFFGTGLRPVPVLAWFAAAPVMALALALPRAREAFTWSALAFALGATNLAAYLGGLLPPHLVALALLGPALVFGLCVTLARTAARSNLSAIAVLTLPAAWALYESAFSWLPGNGSYGSLAYSQMDFLPAVQVASLFGHTAISFTLLLASSGLALAWHHRRSPARTLATLFVATTVVAASLGFGMARLRAAAAAPRVRVGLSATDRTIRAFRTTDRDTALAVVDAYMSRVDRLAARGARVVVLPEKFVGVSDNAQAAVLARFLDTSRRDHVLLVAGINRLFAHSKHNWAVMTRDGEDEGHYDKAHMVPHWEAGYYQAEQMWTLAHDGLPRLGVAICRDMDFPSWTLRYANARVDVMLVPAWDFGDDAWLHSRMAVLRGVEGGFAIARTAQDGRLTLSDPYGRVLAEAESGDGDEALLVGDLPARRVATPFAGRGPLLVLLWNAWLLAAVLPAVRRRA